MTAAVAAILVVTQLSQELITWLLFTKVHKTAANVSEQPESGSLCMRGVNVFYSWRGGVIKGVFL